MSGCCQHLTYSALTISVSDNTSVAAGGGPQKRRCSHHTHEGNKQQVSHAASMCEFMQTSSVSYCHVWPMTQEFYIWDYSEDVSKKLQRNKKTSKTGHNTPEQHTPEDIIVALCSISGLYINVVRTHFLPYCPEHTPKVMTDKSGCFGTVFPQLKSIKTCSTGHNTTAQT